jgi:hypothetical protein
VWALEHRQVEVLLGETENPAPLERESAGWSRKAESNSCRSSSAPPIETEQNWWIPGRAALLLEAGSAPGEVAGTAHQAPIGS